MIVPQSLTYAHRHLYYLSQPISGKETSLWIVFHGYGQLANYFLRKFAPFTSEDRLIVAPEGLNRQYLNGFSGRVGANWMTKHERSTAIENTNIYLNALMSELLARLPHLQVVHSLGFSQGAATMSRWICQTDISLDKVIFWGGAPAYDLEPDLLREQLQNCRVLVARGEADPFLETEQFREAQARMLEAGIPDLRTFTYPGGHELEPALLKQLFLM
ncbi:alpha/beta hydrolase [Cyclobacterium xiamenense]|uniref:alpha/beta hydrolase n=1 Tax=Cyclobacterium xiamenense TaxID=1297121 RepID=UPI0035D073D4